MTRAVSQLSRWIEGVEELTLVQVGQPSRRWSWFQIAWAGLHATAIVMHVLSVLYHVRRAACTDVDEPLFVAGCPATHVRTPVSLVTRREAADHDARSAVS
jgi:hypothetical protein